MSALKRGCLSVVIVVGVMVVGGYIYFSINPPLALPETGYLSAVKTRDVRLVSGAEPRAYRLRVELTSRIYEQGGAAFPPARVTATVVGAGGAGSTTIEVLPMSGPAIRLSDAEGPGTATWGLDCDTGTTGSCSAEYILVIRPNGSGASLEATLEVFAEQEFPPHVPTPLMAGIDVDLDEIEIPARLFETDSEGHSATVEPDAPVAMFDIEIESPADAVLAGATMTVSVQRLDPLIAVGPDGPPPVQVVLVDGGNRIVADIGPRPGTPTRVALPPVQGDYRLVAWWQDWADQSYEITWEIEAGSVADSGRPRVDAVPRAAAPASDTMTSSGEVTVGGPAETDRIGFGVERDVEGPTETGQLPAAIGVLHARLEMTEFEGESPLLLVVGGSSGPQIPVVLRIGAPVELALDAEADCQGHRCGAWGGTLTDPTDSESPATFRAATIRWDSTLVVWPLEPAE